MSQAVKKVEVWSEPMIKGKRRRVFHVKRGIIYLRADQFKNLLRSTLPAHQES
jgi:hypothetical protein